MNKLLAVFIFCSVGSFAQADEGSIILRDGSSTVRISVGDNISSDRRIRRLERAVRDLQNRVYELETDEPTRLWTCKAEAFGKIFYGEGVTRSRAERRAQENCQSSYHSMHCDIESCSDE